MRQTQTSRPITALSISDDSYGSNPAPAKSLGVVRYDLIVSLQMSNIPVGFASEFDTLPVFPVLESAELIFASGINGWGGIKTVVDIGRVFLFLSKTHVRDVDLVFNCSMEPLHDDGIRALGSLHSVQRLRVRVAGNDRGRAFANSDAGIAALLTVSWPELQSMSLSFGLMSIGQSCALLSSASKLETLKLDQLDSIDVSWLALLAHRCPNISSISITGPAGDALKLTDLVVLFQHYSFPVFSCLQSLRLELCSVDDDALHWLLPRLCPHIEQLIINKNENNPHRLRFFVYLFHVLPNLKSLDLQPVDDMDPSPDSMFVYNLSRRMLPDVFGCEFVDWSRTRFRRVRNSNGLTGRESSFAALYDTLNRKEKQRLAAWDAGNYDWVPAESEVYSESDEPEYWTYPSSDEGASDEDEDSEDDDNSSEEDNGDDE